MINNVTIAGRLTKDVELKKTANGTSVASFTLAVNRRFAKEGQQEADFVSCIAWRQSADYLASYAGKGALIGLEGRIQTRSYDDNNGRKVYVTEVVADNVTILSKPNQTAQNQQTETNEYNSLEFGQNLSIDPDDLPF